MPQRLGTAALGAGASRRRQREQGQARPGAAEWAAVGQATGFLTGPERGGRRRRRPPRPPMRAGRPGHGRHGKAVLGVSEGLSCGPIEAEPPDVQDGPDHPCTSLPDPLHPVARWLPGWHPRPGEPLESTGAPQAGASGLIPSGLKAGPQGALCVSPFTWLFRRRLLPSTSPAGSVT